MKVCLVSTNRQIRHLCREALLEFQGRDWDFRTISSPDQICAADLTIWDVTPGLAPLEKVNLNQKGKSIFLVDREDIVALLERPPAALSILLKPVNRRLLHDFLDNVLTGHDAYHRSIDANDVRQLRADRDDILQSLLHCNLKLQEFDQDRTRFLARCAHELRAPLMAVSGYCSMLLDGHVGSLNDHQTKILERMRHSTHRLSRLTQNVFEMSMGRYLNSSPTVEIGDIKACIAQAVHESSLVADAKEITIHVKADTPTSPIRFSPSQIEQVLINLLDNACRCTPKRGRIEILAGPVFWDRRSSNMIENRGIEDRRGVSSKKPNAFRIEVSDSGPGIQWNNLARIFEESVCGSPKGDLSHGGLGLSICRQIIQAHHGYIAAESNEGGARFVLMLPDAQSELNPQPIAGELEEPAALRRGA